MTSPTDYLGPSRFHYRVWHDRKGVMLHAYHVGILAIELAELMARESSDEAYPWKALTLMQSTGLQDKNGKEIFEGDIIEIDRPHPSYKHTTKATIEFGEHETSSDYYASRAYGWYADSGGSDGVVSMAQIVERFAVIGNIHEHPHLLEKER